MGFVATMFALSAICSLTLALSWRRQAHKAEHELAELRAELRHQSHVQDARRSLIKELVDARTRRN